ncbi:MAG: acetate kinase [Gammaproteobacteria bacterium]|nr:acetate kinase [Gammaproteobacteria bacterium]
MPTILVLNCGSSSIKFALYPCTSGHPVATTPLCEGTASRLQEAGNGQLRITHNGEQQQLALAGDGHAGALQAIIRQLDQWHLLDDVSAVGHRVVHGGDRFRQPALIDADVIAQIEHYSDYAPLHNPVNLEGIRIARQLLPALPQVAIFDTAFHGTLPPVAFHYAVPAQWHSQWGVRRYGFHGTSHQFIAESIPALTGTAPDAVRAVSAHLGNGCSLCAIKGQHSIDTSMGFTPLEGLVMGSRCGDLDPGLHEYLADKLGIDIHQLTELLNREAGLKGVSGIGNDMRELLQAASQDHAGAQLAVNLFCYRLAKSIASYLVPLGRIDALAFTGGIGENAAPVRAQVIELLQGLGFRIDPGKNNARSQEPRNIAPAGAPAVLVIPTREEWMIARQTAQLLARPDTENA